jgi:adenylosuccinate synthase
MVMFPKGDFLMVKAIVGANWGDEGKGKVTDMLASEADIVIRFQGGANAGHTIINHYGKFALHLLPSGVFSDRATNIIGNGVALNIPALLKELKQIVAGGVPEPRLLISNRAQIVMPYHILFDQYEEERLSHRQFGSTKSGIAPFYSDKYAKIGFQVSELYDEQLLKEKLENVLALKNVLLENLYKKPVLQVEELFGQLIEWREAIDPYVADTVSYLSEAVKAGKVILLEGQLGSLKDPDFGIYPFTTSSSTLAGYGAVGAGLPPYEIKDIIAVTKAYSSAVGAGAFVSEIEDIDQADELRRRGGDAGEYGATTGRPRRMGWFDCVATRYGCQVQGATQVVLTAIDVLSYLDEIPVCIGYEIDGQVTRDFPPTTQLNRAKPVFEVLKGWKTDVRGITRFEDLPELAQQYVLYIENELNVPIKMVSNGPKREEIIHR